MRLAWTSESLRVRAAAGEADEAARLVELLDREPVPESLLDLSGYAVKGDDDYEQARRELEQAALNAVAARDRALLEELLQAFERSYQAAKDRESALDFEDLQLRARDLLRDNETIREREQLRFRQVCVDEFQDTNRLQCEVIDLIARGDLFFVGDEFQSIYRFRHADVEVFKERREQVGEVLPLTQNWRSRPEVLAVVNHLFAATFGDEFQRARRRGAVPRARRPAPRSSCSSRIRPSYKETGVAWRRGEAKAVARRVQRAGRVGRGGAGRDRAALRRRHGCRAVRGGAARSSACRPTAQPAAGTSASSRSSTCSGTCGCSTTATTTRRSSPFSLRRSSGVSNDALVLLRRAAPRRPLFVGLERGLPEALAERDARLLQAFRQRYDRLAAIAGTVGLERLCEQIVVEHDYDLAVLAQWDGRRRYANLRKLARLARSYEELRGPDIEGFVRFVLEQDAAGVQGARGGRGGGGRRARCGC